MTSNSVDDARRKPTERNPLRKLLTERGQVSYDDLLAGSTINSLTLVALIIAVAAEFGPGFVGKIQKILASLDKSIGDDLRADLSPGAAKAFANAVETGDEILEVIGANTLVGAEADVRGEAGKGATRDIARGPSMQEQLIALRDHQDAAEMMLMMIAASHPRLDSLVEALDEVRTSAAKAGPDRRGVVEAYDSYLSSLRMMQDARAGRRSA